MPRLSILLICVICAICGKNSFAQSSASLIRPNDHIAFIGNTFADQLKREGYLETLLLQRVTNTDGTPSLSFRNLGWGGDTLTQRDRPTNFPTEDATLTEFGATVLLLSFGLSESFAGDAGLAEFRTNYEALIDHYLAQKYNSESAPRLVLLSPIAFEDLGELTPNATERNKDLSAYTKAIGEIASIKDCGFVDLHAPTLAHFSKAEGPQLTVNGVHLGATGYWHVGRLLADALAPASQTWSVEVDFNGLESSSLNASIQNATPISGGFALTVLENGYPAPPPPEATGASLDQLIVHNLPSATYTLTIDGEEIATATATEWASGIALDNSPTHREVEAYRAQVVDKNEQFTFSWKALNQVHIVGERKTSNSGKELPREVIEFNELAKAKDADLQTLPPNNRTREWRLTATPEK